MWFCSFEKPNLYIKKKITRNNNNIIFYKNVKALVLYFGVGILFTQFIFI